MTKKYKNNSNVYLTQHELAARWRVSESSLASWRGRGILPFFRIPGSARILYPVVEIEKFEKENIYKQEVKPKSKKSDNKGEKHVIPAKSNRNWRV